MSRISRGSAVFEAFFRREHRLRRLRAAGHLASERIHSKEAALHLGESEIRTRHGGPAGRSAFMQEPYEIIESYLVGNRRRLL